jgi:multidrug resistance efflux pump
MRNRASNLMYLLAATIIGAAVWAYMTPIDISVRSRGIVRPEGEPIRIVAEVGGNIRRIHVAEGDLVNAHEPLLELDVRDLLLKQQTVESQIRFAESRLRDFERYLDQTMAVEEDVAQAEWLEYEAARQSVDATVQTDRDRFDRMRFLYQEGLVAKQVYDESRTALDQAEAEKLRLSARPPQLKRAQSKLQVQKTMAETIPLRSELASLHTELGQIHIEIERRTICSPAEGRITSLAVLHKDETISPGATVAAIVPATHALLVEASVPTFERSHIFAGQRVRLRSESVPADANDAFDGVVQYISPDARFNESLNGGYRVLIRPADSSRPLRLGATFELHFLTREERLLSILFEKLRAGFR